MPVYLFTFHAYRSWNADNPRGFVRSTARLLPPDTEMADHYDQNASEEPVLFDRRSQQILIWAFSDACQRREWRLHGIATEPTHVHLMVSWKGDAGWSHVRDRLKNVASLLLGRKLSRPGRRWFSRKGSRKRVEDQTHYDHLMRNYLPKHSGLCWQEGDSPPEEPPPIVDPEK